ncbi:hypothetical protein ACFWY9_10250 [Amycolatopsis sp. NPDC059027]|uniref:hypothetical protein n=1 Tax=Amycolatopsis sp. NPDC059027 TaxID=3346709 RepID=UPI00366F158F
MDYNPATGEFYEVDQELVERLFSQALIDAGFVFEDEDPPRANVKLLPAAVLEVMQANHIAAVKRDMAKKAVTKFELYAELFPEGPGVREVAEQSEARVVQADLMKRLWTLTNTGPTGFVQKNVGDGGYVLCEAHVPRTKLNEESGKRQPTTEPGRFLTTDRDLIITHYTGPAGAAFIRAARRLEAQLGLVGERRPELVTPVARQASAAMKQAVAAVPHADVKQATALTAAETSDGVA